MGFHAVLYTHNLSSHASSHAYLLDIVAQQTYSLRALIYSFTIASAYSSFRWIMASIGISSVFVIIEIFCFQNQVPYLDSVIEIHIFKLQFILHLGPNLIEASILAFECMVRLGPILNSVKVRKSPLELHNFFPQKNLRSSYMMDIAIFEKFVSTLKDSKWNYHESTVWHYFGRSCETETSADIFDRVIASVCKADTIYLGCSGRNVYNISITPHGRKEYRKASTLSRKEKITYKPSYISKVSHQCIFSPYY